MGYRFIFVLMQWIPAKVRGGVIIHHTLSCVIAFDLTLHCLLILLCQGKIITNKHSSSTSAFPWSIECNLFALWQANLLFGLPDAAMKHKFSKRSMPEPQMMYFCSHKVSNWCHLVEQETMSLWSKWMPALFCFYFLKCGCILQTG